VKVVVLFKGRELQYKDLGKDLLLKIFQPLDAVALMENPPKIEGKAYAMLLGPKKQI
jgi:translation initiation factor IF-3